MRFKRSDLPGFAIAILAGPALTVLFLASFDVWDHHGTPLVAFVGSNVGLMAGVAAVFSRFIRKWAVPVACIVVILVVVATVNWAQHTGNDGTALATGLKWLGVVAFLVLNASVLLQLATYGLLPILDRRDARRAAQASK